MIRKARPYILIAAILATVATVVYAIQDPSFNFHQKELSLGLKTLFNAVTFMLYCIVLIFSIIGGKSRFVQSAVKGLKILIWLLILYIAGTLATRFVKTSMPSLVTWISTGVVGAVFIWRYFARRRRFANEVSGSSIRRSASGVGEVKYARTMLHGALLAAMAVTVLFFFLTLKSGDNYFILAPLGSILLCMILRKFCRWRGWLLVAIVSVTAQAIVFIYGTWAAYKFGALASALAFSLLYLALLVPLCDLYCRKEQAI